MIGIYSRQSVDKKDSISIENQIDFCKKEFLDSEEYKVYIDKGYSGKNTNRPAFEDMIKDVKAGIIKKVIVYKLDRISRSVLDFATIIDIFKKHDVNFISSTEKFDTSTPIGNAMLSIIMVFAQLERETIQKRIKDNYYARGKRGFFMGGRVPYGYIKVKTKIDGINTSKFEQDNIQMPILIKMYKLYANTDMSLGKISDYLNDLNIKSSEGSAWDSNKVSRILRNPIYVKADADIYSYFKNKGCIISNDLSDFIGLYGCYLYGKRESNERKYTNIENHVLSLALHEGVINSGTWLSVQYKLDNNKQIKNSGKGKHTWLTGIAKCGYCKYAVSVVKAGHGNNRYFNCRGKTNLKICKGHNTPIFVDEIEEKIKKQVLVQVGKLKDVKLRKNIHENASVNNLKIQLASIDDQINNLINQLAEANNVTMKYINSKISELDNKKHEIIEEIKQITYNNTKQLQMDDLIESVNKWDDLDLTKKRDVCISLMHKFFIYDDNVVEIDWKEPLPIK